MPKSGPALRDADSINPDRCPGSWRGWVVATMFSQSLGRPEVNRPATLDLERFSNSLFEIPVIISSGCPRHRHLSSWGFFPIIYKFTGTLGAIDLSVESI